MNRDIFKKRVNLKPYEYPEIIDFKDAIRTSYWISEEFNYTADIQDFKTNVSEIEKEAITRAMMAISQIEVSVKRFWSDLYYYMPKPEIDAVGVTFGECHIEGTEVLTPEGWKDFRDINKGDEVLQYNPDGTLEFVPTLAVTKQDYNGVMYKFMKRTLEAVVTPNHRMIFKSNNDTIEEESAEVFRYKSSKRTPFAGNVIGEIDTLSFEERIYIAIQADGHLRHFRDNHGEYKPRGRGKNYIYSVSLIREDKIQRLQWLLDNSSLKYKKYYTSREGHCIYHIWTDPVNYKNFDWVKTKGKSHFWFREFIEEALHWDGTKILGNDNFKRKDFYRNLIGVYHNGNKSCVNRMQEFGTLAGYRSNINVYSPPASGVPMYKVSFIKSQYWTRTLAAKTSIRYNGKVYCCTVPSGILLTRYKDTVLISGNSEQRHADAYANLLELLGLNEMFEKLHEYKPLMARVEYMEKFMRGKNEGEKGFILSMILFSLFVEHISLFSQFVLIMSFNKHRNLFKGMSNAIEATSKEEELHGKFGIALYNIVKEEHPEIFTTEFYQELHQLASDAFKAEMDIIDWIYEKGDIPFISKNTIINYIKHRYNNSFVSLGQERIYDVDETLLKEVSWFDEELISTKEVDFFNKRSIDYSKRGKAITADDLF